MLEWRGAITHPSSRVETVRVRIHEPRPADLAPYAAVVEANPVLGKPRRIFGQDAMQAFQLAQEFVFGATRGIWLWARITQDAGWSPAFGHERSKLRAAFSDPPFSRYLFWRGPGGRRTFAALTAPRAVEPANWAVQVRAPLLTPLPLMTSGYPRARDALPWAVRTLDGLAESRGFQRCEKISHWRKNSLDFSSK